MSALRWLRCHECDRDVRLLVVRQWPQPSLCPACAVEAAKKRAARVARFYRDLREAWMRDEERYEHRQGCAWCAAAFGGQAPEGGLAAQCARMATLRKGERLNASEGN